VNRAVMMALALGALAAAGCKRKPALVQTPVSQLPPLGGTAIPPPEEDPAPQPQRAATRPVSVTDAGVVKAAPAAPALKPTAPTVANPYVPGGGREKLPMWKQRAKFY
jgi:hypothetical protein